MQDALSVAIDDLVDVDLSEWSDAAIEAEFVALRRNQDRLDAHAARLLVGVQDRLIPAAIGASSSRRGRSGRPVYGCMRRSRC